MIKNINFTLRIQFVSIGLLLLIFILRFSRLPPQIPLYYSKPEGDEQIVDSLMIFLLPLLSFLTIRINTHIIKKYFNNNLFVNSLIYWINLFVILLSDLIFLKILFLVT